MISDAELDRWGEAAERGDYGGSKGPVMHGSIFPRGHRLSLYRLTGHFRGHAGVGRREGQAVGCWA